MKKQTINLLLLFVSISVVSIPLSAEKLQATTDESISIKAIDCRDFIADSELYSNVEKNVQKYEKQFIPEKDDFIEVKEIPNTVQVLDSYIYNYTKKYNVDVDMIKALVCTSFSNYKSSLSQTAESLCEFLKVNVPLLEKNLQRYDGNYRLAIEAMYRGVSDIDILYATFKEDWDKHIKDIPYITGSCYVEQREKLIDTPYYLEVYKYYWRYEDGK